MAKRRLALAFLFGGWFTGLTGLGGCEAIASFDHSKIPSARTDAGTSTPSDAGFDAASSQDAMLPPSDAGHDAAVDGAASTHHDAAVGGDDAATPVVPTDDASVDAGTLDAG
ncbi:MAG TPA: hypothetical protein VF331_21385 [Polyangiales bacterium]